jgi:hypothetical protein
MREISFIRVKTFKFLLDGLGVMGWRGYRRFASALAANDFWQSLVKQGRQVGAWKIEKDDSNTPFVVGWM